MSDNYPIMISLREASRKTGLSYEFLRSMCHKGELVHIRAGNKFLVNLDRLMEYLNTAGVNND